MTEFSIKDIKNKSIGQLYKETKLDEKVLKEISEIGNEKIDKIIDAKCKTEEQKVNEEEKRKTLKEIYRNIVDILKKYCDLREEYYPLIAIWIIGTYFHNEFITYPYLFFNAMKGSGKTRLLKLIAMLSKDGEMLNSLKEAVLFRTKGTLCIDEFEGIGRKGNEALRELLNSDYKKGTKVKRMRKVKTFVGEKQVVEEFDVYRPIAIANIWGMESVLGDRCFHLVLEKSNNPRITRLVEAFDVDQLINNTLLLLKSDKCSLCSFLSVEYIYLFWNEKTTQTTQTTPFSNTKTTQTTQTTQTKNYTNYTNNTNYTNYTNYTKILEKSFEKIFLSEIDGRHLELAFPLLIISMEIGEDVFDRILDILKIITEEQKQEDFSENRDILLIDYVSQLPESKQQPFKSISTITSEFRDFLGGTAGEWCNNKWVGRALKRLGLIVDKRRIYGGIEIMLDIKKAQKKIKMFK